MREIRRRATNKPQALVHYDGWGPQYDEWIEIYSSRLAELGTNARIDL